LKIVNWIWFNLLSIILNKHWRPYFEQISMGLTKNYSNILHQFPPYSLAFSLIIILIFLSLLSNNKTKMWKPFIYYTSYNYHHSTSLLYYSRYIHIYPTIKHNQFPNRRNIGIVVIVLTLFVVILFFGIVLSILYWFSDQFVLILATCWSFYL
jgi:hypothetical protein